MLCVLFLLLLLLCCVLSLFLVFFFFFKQKTAYEMRISDWSSDVCSSSAASRSSRTASLARDIEATSARATCPISSSLAAEGMVAGSLSAERALAICSSGRTTVLDMMRRPHKALNTAATRSEERRVGKEGGRKGSSRGAP